MVSAPIISISSIAFATPLQFILDDNQPVSSGGYTVMVDVERPKRRSATTWSGMTPYRLAIPGMFDGWSTSQSVEASIKKLEILATARHGVLEPPPPVTIVSGPVPRKELTWQVESIEWRDAIWVGDERHRQRFTLGLVQKVDLETVAREQARRPSKGKVHYRKVNLQAGLNLRELAAIMLGNSARWTDFRSKEGKKFRDYRQPPGTVIKVPRT